MIGIKYKKRNGLKLCILYKLPLRKSSFLGNIHVANRKLCDFYEEKTVILCNLYLIRRQNILKPGLLYCVRIL